MKRIFIGYSIDKRILDIIKDKSKYIIEGVQCYRILRTGIKENIYTPDLIINILSKYSCLDKHKAMRKTLDKIYTEYKMMVKYSMNKPNIINITGE